MTSMTLNRPTRRAVRAVDWESVFGWSLVVVAVVVWTVVGVGFAAL